MQYSINSFDKISILLGVECIMKAIKKTAIVILSILIIFIVSCDGKLDKVKINNKPTFSERADQKIDNRIFELSSKYRFFSDMQVVDKIDFNTITENWIDTVESRFDIKLKIHSLALDSANLNSFSVNPKNYEYLKSSIEDSYVNGLFQITYMDTVRMLSEDGMILPLDTYLGDNKNWNLFPEGWKNAYKIKDVTWAIPTSYINRAHTRYIRKDWLNVLELEIPYTINDLYNVMKAFTYEDPDKDGTTNTSGAVYRGIRGLEDIFSSFDIRMNYNGKFSPTWNPNKNIWEDSLLKPQLEACLDFISQCIDEGVLVKETITNNDNQFLTGYSGSYCSDLPVHANAAEHIIISRPECKNPEIQYIPGLVNVINTKITGYHTAYTSPYVLTKNSTSPNSTINILIDNFIVDEKGYMLARFGEEGVTYYLKNNILYSKTFSENGKIRSFPKPSLVGTSPFHDVITIKPDYMDNDNPVAYDLFRDRINLMKNNELCYEIPYWVVYSDVDNSMVANLKMIEKIASNTVNGIILGAIDYDTGIKQYRDLAEKIGMQDFMDEQNRRLGKVSAQKY